MLGFSRERRSSCICKVLEATALPSVTGVGRKDVGQLACYLPDPVSQCLCFCERVAPDKAQGMHSPCIQVQGVFSFFFFSWHHRMWRCLTGLTCSAVMSRWEKGDKCSYLSPQVLLLGDELCHSALTLTNAPQCISVQMCFLFIFK